MRSEAIVVNASFYVFSSFAICIGSRTRSLYWQPAVMTDAKLNKKSVITLSITEFFSCCGTAQHTLPPCACSVSYDV
jgi:hypothetical protein